MPIATHSDNGASEVHTHHELDLPVMSTLRKSDIETLLKKKKTTDKSTSNSSL